MTNKRSLALLLVLGCLVAACVQPPAPSSPSAQPPAGEDEGVPTDEELPEVVPAGPQVILYEDDFSDVNSGWEQYRALDGVLDYEDGGYRMYVDTTNNMFWVQANLTNPLADLIIQVEATQLGGPQDAPFGVICRLDEQYQYYYFYITSGGEYGIGKKVAEGGFLVDKLIGMDTPGVSSAIHQGGSVVNEIVASCIGQTYSLTVNGQLLAEVQDDGILEGDVGLLAGVRTEPMIDVWFDYIKVFQP